MRGGGHRIGGPFAFLAVLAGCGGTPAPSGPEPLDAARPLDTYRQLGFLAGPASFPAVGGFATLAGPGDSTWVVFGLSLPASALRFQREGEGFAATYHVGVTFERDSIAVQQFQSRERVHVGSFAETGRTDESIVFQQAVALVPGRYVVELTAGDGRGARGFTARDTIDVPGHGRTGLALAPPAVVHRASPRATTAETPDLILNARHTTPYGGEPPRIHLEAYRARAPVPVVVRVVDDGGREIWRGREVIESGDSVVRTALVELPRDTLPLGRLRVEVAAPGATAQTSPLVVSISDEWMVANFDQVLDFIRFLATEEELEALSAGSPTERRSLWEEFWRRRDPVAATPANEFREEFFDRVRFAAEQFAEDTQPGWQTDRGEVFIVLGPPDRVIERVGRNETGGRASGLEWVYAGLPGGRISVSFVDRSGFGRYRLIPSSRATFRTVAERLRPRS